MDRSYMLNSYIKENEENFNSQNNANNYWYNFSFRVNGCKSIPQLKQEVNIFLQKNNVPALISSELAKVCNSFDENTDIYKAEMYLDNILLKYKEEQEKEYNKSNETVTEIKEEVVEKAIDNLAKVGIKVVGNQSSLIDSVDGESAVYKLNDNVEKTVTYLENRNEQIDIETISETEISVDALEESLDTPSNETVLATVLETEEKTNDTPAIDNTEIMDDGSLVMEVDSHNPDSLNATYMLIAALVASKTIAGLTTGLDMKAIKKEENLNSLKIIYGQFPLTNNSKLDPVMKAKIAEIINSYNPNVNYFETLNKISPELATSINLVQNHIFNKEGAFQMAVKNGGINHDIVFAMDEKLADVMIAFRESGAMISQDLSENNIIRIPNTTPGDQLVILNATVENLNEKKLQVTAVNQLQNQYQKQLTLPTNMNQAANVNSTLLTVIAFAEIILLGFFFYFIFK